MQHSPTRSSGVVDRKGGVDTDDANTLAHPLGQRRRVHARRRPIGGTSRRRGRGPGSASTAPTSSPKRPECPGRGRRSCRLLADKMTIVLIVAAAVSAAVSREWDNPGGDPGGDHHEHGAELCAGGARRRAACRRCATCRSRTRGCAVTAAHTPRPPFRTGARRRRAARGRRRRSPTAGPSWRPPACRSPNRALTGEIATRGQDRSTPSTTADVQLADRTNMLYMNTAVTRGHAGDGGDGRRYGHRDRRHRHRCSGRGRAAAVDCR